MAGSRKLIAGNWKMNGLRAGGLALARDLATRTRAEPPGRCDVLVCPPATLLCEVAAALAGTAVALGGQDCHAAASGAHTGDISAEMLKDAGCAYVILGHSERRQHHGERDADIKAKVLAAWRAGLVAIVCVGETQDERSAGGAVAIVATQLAGSIPEGADSDRIVVAYEPIWAIGTGLTANAGDITEMHAAIGARVPSGTRLLYGGSVNAANAASILPLAGVDGALVGGACLKAPDFWTIVQSAG